MRLRLATTLVLALAGAAPAQSVRERMGEAQAALHEKRFDQALPLFEALAKDQAVPREDRAAAWSRIGEIHRVRKRWEPAIAAQRELLALQQEDDGRTRVSLQIADLQVQGGQVPAAVQTLKDLAAKHPDEDDHVAGVNLLAANYLVRDKQHAAAVEFFDAAAARMDDEDPRKSDAMWSASTALWASEQWERSIGLAKVLADPRYRGNPRLANREANGRVIAGLIKLNREADAVALLKEWEGSDPDAEQRPRWCLAAARTARQAKDEDGALASYRRLFTVHAGVPVSDGWFEAQGAIVDDHVRKNDLPTALKASHVLIDAAPDQAALTAAVQKAVEILTKLDGNKDRAKALVGYQLQGAAAKGKDPLPDIGYHVDPEVVAAFAKAFAEVGDDAGATFHRGQICLYSGKPSAAAALYLQAARRSTLEQWPAFVGAAIMNGWRPLNGSGVGMDSAVKFFVNGPEAGDDPFKPFKLDDPPYPMPAVNDDQWQQAEALRASLWDVVVDRAMVPAVRHAALLGISKLNGATQTDADPDRYLVLAAEADAPLRDLASMLALNAARGGAPHLAGSRALLASNRLPQNAAKRADPEFKRLVKQVEKFGAKNAGVPKMSPIK